MPSTIGDKTYSKSIELPETEVFRNLKNAKRFAMDIGMVFSFYNKALTTPPTFEDMYSVVTKQH